MRFGMKKWGLTALIFAMMFGFGIQSVQAGPMIKISDQSWLLINYSSQLYGVWRDTGSGPDATDDSSDIFFRRNRLTFFGKATKTLKFNLQIEHKGTRMIQNLGVDSSPGGGLDILDAFLMAKYSNAFRLRLGLTKDPLTRENNEGCFDPLTLDRSLFIYTPFQVSRDTGLVVWGNLLKNRLQYRASIMEGRESADTPKSSLRYTGRVHVTLLNPESSIIYRGTYLGKKKVLTLGGGYQFEPDVAYASLTTHELPVDNTTWTVDAFFEYPTPAGTFTVSGAYLDVDFDDAYKGPDPDDAVINVLGERNGWYAKAGYLFPSKIGIGKVQLFGRYEDWKFAELNGIGDQTIKWTGLGINYLINNQKLRLTVEYAKTDYETEDATNKDFDTVTTMVQFMF